MSNPRERNRSLISGLIAVVVVFTTLVVLAVVRVGSLFRPKYVPIEQLKFPVLVLQPAGAALFAEWDSTALQKFPEGSTRTPVNGTIIIDSTFNQFTQENVARQKEGDLKWMARHLLPGLRVKYTFDLRRRAGASGREGLAKIIREAPRLSEDAAEDAAMRSAALQQTTMDGVLDALRLYKPAEPATQAAAAELGEPEVVVDQSMPTTTEVEPAKPGSQ
jgi:hypothetical protein